MILRYSRLSSTFLIAVSLPLGLTLLMSLINGTSAVSPGAQPIAWALVVVSTLVTLRSLRLILAPPIVLNIKPEGIYIHYRAGSRSFSRNADLLPWQLIKSMRLIRLHGRDNTFNWAIEMELSADPPFDPAKRDALRGSLSRSSDSNFFAIDTFVLDRPRGEVLAILKKEWQKWQKLNVQMPYHGSGTGEIKPSFL